MTKSKGLGDTIEKISKEKAGIIKKNTPVYMFEQNENNVRVYQVVLKHVQPFPDNIHLFSLFQQLHQTQDSLRASYQLINPYLIPYYPLILSYLLILSIL